MFCVSATGLGASMWENDHVTLGVALRQPEPKVAADFSLLAAAANSTSLDVLRLPHPARIAAVVLS